MSHISTEWQNEISLNKLLLSQNYSNQKQLISSRDPRTVRGEMVRYFKVFEFFGPDAARSLDFKIVLVRYERFQDFGISCVFRCQRMRTVSKETDLNFGIIEFVVPENPPKTPWKFQAETYLFPRIWPLGIQSRYEG